MMAALRGRTSWRPALVVLSFLALALKVMVPSGYMPGTSLAVPIVLCPGQGSMAMMVHSGHAPSKTPHDGTDHPCAFAGMGMAAVSAPSGGHEVVPPAVIPAWIAVPVSALVPGRGLAAPPPPSRAPPIDRT